MKGNRVGVGINQNLTSNPAYCRKYGKCPKGKDIVLIFSFVFFPPAFLLSCVVINSDSDSAREEKRAKICEISSEGKYPLRLRS